MEEKSFKNAALTAIGIGSISLIAGGTAIFTGLKTMKNRAGKTDRAVLVIFGASMMYLSTAMIDGGIHILKEEGVIK